MGITVYYRGSIADRERVEEFEDRVLDMALEIGASAQVWRSTADHDPTRLVRGLLLDLSPGQETTSLLLSPEGWLIPLTEIETAEQGPFADPPYCSVKTHFGSVEGHVALIELLTFLKQEFFLDLTVIDDGGYWDTRDLPALVRNFHRTRALIDALRQGLQQSGLSAEAAEDPEILATRMERIAQQVHKTLRRPPEHPPVDWDDPSGGDELNEAQWDAFYKEQRRMQERLHRAMEEQLQQGLDHSTAFEDALRNEGIDEPNGEADPPDAADDSATFREGLEDWDDELAELWGGPEDEVDEAWRESLPPEIGSDDRLEEDRERHPLQQAASDLWLRLHHRFEGLGEPESQQTRTLMHAAGEIAGGLAQALSPSAGDHLDRGRVLVQLKRAWRGTAFAKGALLPLCAAGLLHARDLDEVRVALAELTNGIVEEIARIGRTTE